MSTENAPKIVLAEGEKADTVIASADAIAAAAAAAAVVIPPNKVN
jgi:hypothetical protein